MNSKKLLKVDLRRFKSEELLFELTQRDPSGVGLCATNHIGDHEFLVGIGKDLTYFLRLEDDQYQGLIEVVYNVKRCEADYESL